MCVCTCGVAVTEGGVEAYVSQLASSDVLLLGSHVGKDNAARPDAKLLSLSQDVGLAVGREAQEPDHRLRDALQDLVRKWRVT